MDKSGSRYSALKSPIIHSPHLQSSRQRLVSGALTAGFWAFWLYLWLPLLALLAWALGLQQAYKYMIVLGGYHDTIRLLALYAVIIALLGGALVIWALYNIIRFRGVEQRRARAPINATDIARDFSLDQSEVERWQDMRSLHVFHDKHGAISSVVAGDAV